MPIGEKYIFDSLLVVFLIKRDSLTAMILAKNVDAAAITSVTTVVVVKTSSEDKIAERAAVAVNVIKR